MTVKPQELIWIAEAERIFNKSREWFIKQIKLGKLREIKIEGDRKVYLLRSEVEQLLQPRKADL